VDASQGAEEMLEHLTKKVLDQEEQIQQLEDEKNDLASFHWFFFWQFPRPFHLHYIEVIHNGLSKNC